MAFQKSKNVWMVLGVASVAIAVVVVSIALGVTLTRSNDQHGSNNQNSTSTSHLLRCPMEEGSSPLFSVTDLVHPEAFELDISPAGTLCTLVRIFNPQNDGLRENIFLQPIGRSYSNRTWDRVRGKFTTETSFVCHDNDSKCTIDLNQLEAKAGGGAYQLTTFYDPFQCTTKDVIARFLEQATFGPTTASINYMYTQLGEDNKKDALKHSLVLAQWIQDQQNVAVTPIMSHRAVYRRHLNARFEEAGPVGRVSLPCEKGARFRRFTFSEKDVDKTLTLVTTINNGIQSWQVDGTTRTAFGVSPLQYPAGTSNVPCTLDGDCSLRPCVLPPCPAAAFCVESFCQLVEPNSTKADNNMDKDGAIMEQSSWPDGDYRIYRICKVTFDKWDGSSMVQIQNSDLNKTCVDLVVKASDGFYYSNPPIEIHEDGANDDDGLLLTIPVASAQTINREYAALQSALIADGINNPADPEIILTAALTDAICAEFSTGVKPESAVIAEWSKYMTHLFF